MLIKPGNTFCITFTILCYSDKCQIRLFLSSYRKWVILKCILIQNPYLQEYKILYLSNLRTYNKKILMLVNTANFPYISSVWITVYKSYKYCMIYSPILLRILNFTYFYPSIYNIRNSVHLNASIFFRSGQNGIRRSV
jgi:hypothetical protein